MLEKIFIGLFGIFMCLLLSLLVYGAASLNPNNEE